MTVVGDCFQLHLHVMWALRRHIFVMGQLDNFTPGSAPCWPGGRQCYLNAGETLV